MTDISFHRKRDLCGEREKKTKRNRVSQRRCWEIDQKKYLRSVTEAPREVISIWKCKVCRGSNILYLFAVQINNEETEKRNDRSIQKKTLLNNRMGF